MISLLRQSMAFAAAAALVSLFSKLDAAVLYTSGMSDTFHTDFTYGSSDGSVGYGDDYSTNYTTVDLTGFSFYGGTTIDGEYAAVDFYSSTGVRVASISLQTSPGVGYQTLPAEDFDQNGLTYIPITPTGYVTITPEVESITGPSGTMQIPPAGVNASFTLGFGSAPTVGTNDPNNSAMATFDQTTGNTTLTTGDYVPGVNQYMQFELDGTGTLNAASGTWTSATSGTWENSANWYNSLIASGSTQSATFSAAIGTGSETVTLTANETVGTVAFTNTHGSYTIAATGGNSLTLDNGSFPAVISVKTGSQSITAPIFLANGLNINTAAGTLAAGTLTLGGAVTGTGPLTVTTSNSTLIVSPSGVISVPLIDSGTVQFAAQGSGSSILSRIVPSVGLTSGATMSLAAASSDVARQVLVTGALSLSGTSGSWTGKLDLANNDAIVQGGNLTNLTNQVKQGYNGGNWQGSNGITSSTAAANTSHLTALGVILNDDGTSTTTALYSSFDGVSSGEGDVLLKYTYYGDTNLDGKVDGSDYSRIDAAYSTDKLMPGSLTGWFNGDFNYDGVIDGSDYTLIDNAFNAQGTQLSSSIVSPDAVVPNAAIMAQIAPTSAVSTVPEPTAFATIAAACLSLLGRRRRVICI